MIKTNVTFSEIPFTSSALSLAKNTIAKVHPLKRQYVERALSNEFESIQEAIENTGEHHDYMLSSDVLRVLRVLNIK